MTIGERIKEARIKRGISQTDLADKIGISKQTLYKYENGLITNIPSDKIEAIADVLNVAPGYIMGWTDDGYYTDADTAQMAQEIFDNPELRVLFDAARDATPDDLKTTYDMLMALKKKEDGNND